MGFKIKTVLDKYIIVLALVFFNASSIFAQSISAPVNQFSQICAGTFNQFTTNFNFVGSNNFVLEMSDANGSFSLANLTPISIISSQLVTSPGSFTFSVPTTVAGTGYRLRVVGTSPAIQGQIQPVAFSAYYKSWEEEFSINGGVAEIFICNSSSFTLSVDNPTPSIPNTSPAQFPNLKYRWYKDDVIISGQTGTSLNINSEGIYRVFLEYGGCTTPSSIEKSQFLTVHFVTGGSTFNITSSSGTNFCPSSPTTLSVNPGYGYQWFKDNVLIPGATSNTYQTNQAGTFHVLINQGGCSSNSSSITLNPQSFNASIDLLELPQVNIIIPGETKVITVTTDATTPTYEWYFNGVLMPSETSSSLSTSVAGDYKVVINQTSGCVFSKIILFRLKEGVNAKDIPNVISPNNDGVNDQWIIPQTYISDNTEVLVINSLGKIELKTKNYQNNWPQTPLEFKSVNPVFYYIITKEGEEAKKGSITIIK
jgi:hypothetical protein